MNVFRTVCAVLLAIPLLVFGVNYFLHFFPVAFDDDTPGTQLLKRMREGGLMTFVSLGHIGAAILMLIPQTRFLGALLHLPITIGIVCFHLAMQRSGLVMAIPMLLFNLGALADPERLRMLVG